MSKLFRLVSRARRIVAVQRTPVAVLLRPSSCGFNILLEDLRNCNQHVSCRLLMTNSSNGNIIDPQDKTPPIPHYIVKEGETTEIKRARLLYQSRKRGMLENGLLLSTFAGKYLDSLSTDQLTTYDRLINQPTNDWEIYYWVTGAKETPEEFQSDVMDLLKKHTKNEGKDLRIRQPDLN